MSNGSALVLRADARRLPLGDESVDLIVKSPPYFGQRNYLDGDKSVDDQIGAELTPQDFLAHLWEVAAECWRVLKPTGSMFVNLGDKRSGSGAPGTTSGFGKLGLPDDSRVNGRACTSGSERGSTLEGTAQGARSGLAAYPKAAFGRPKSKQMLPHRYAIGCEDGLADPDGIGWIMRSDMVWSKTNGLPESARDRVRDSHEYWFHLTKQGSYFADLDQIREPYTDAPGNRYARKVIVADEERRAGGTRGMAQTTNAITKEYQADLTTGKLPGSVWRISTEPLNVPEHLDVEHFAAFPIEWPRRLILAFSPPGGIVLDPFGGTGTTAMTARALGRQGISVDKSAAYCALARWRIFESGHNAKVESRTNADRQGILL